MKPVGDKIRFDSYGYTFGRRLRQLRLMRGLTQGELATLSGIHRNQVVNFERNETREGHPANPTYKVQLRLARALNVPLGVLLPDGYAAVADRCHHLAAHDLAVSAQWPISPADTATFSDKEASGRSRIDEHLLPRSAVWEDVARRAAMDHTPAAARLQSALVHRAVGAMRRISHAKCREEARVWAKA